MKIVEEKNCLSLKYFVEKNILNKIELSTKQWNCKLKKKALMVDNIFPFSLQNQFFVDNYCFC